jgi:hypothetical protein
MEHKTLMEEIPYQRTVWIYGFVKTTLSGAFISTGVVLLFNGITNHPLFRGWNEIAIVVGILAILIAIGIIYTIDKWKEVKKREELEIIQKKFEDERKTIVAEREQMKIEFHDEAVEIAKKLVETELEKIKKDI